MIITVIFEWGGNLKRFTRLPALLIIFMISMFISCDVQVQAAQSPLDIQIQTAFDNKVKPNHAFPVKITVTNPGTEVSGQLVIELAGRSSEGNVAFVKTLDLPQNSSKEVWLTLPSMNYNRHNNRVLFYKDRIAEQNVMPFKQGNVYIDTAVIPESIAQIGILAPDKDTLNFLNILNQSREQVNLIPLTQQQLPDAAHMLKTLDYIVINDFATSLLTERQVQAIEGWVEQGGTLVLAGGVGYAKSVEAFPHLSPIALQGTTTLTELNAFVNATGRELILTRPLTVSYGELIAGEHVMSEDGMPLFTKRVIHNGAVLYVAYDLSLEPLASWSGHSFIWERLINEHTVTNVQLEYTDLWNVHQNLGYFAQLVPPKLGVLLLFFIVYLVVVAPLLYVVLKKRDKREWAWVLVPVCALLASIGIFAYGAADRSTTLAQSLNVIELFGDGKGLQTSYTGVFVPTGGTYDIELPQGKVEALFSTNLHGGNDLNGQLAQLYYVDDRQTRLEFRGVPYWSIRKFIAIDAHSKPYGQLDYELYVHPSGVQGTVTNLTGEQLHHVTVYVNGQYSYLGDIPPGASEDVSLTFASTANHINFSGGYYGTARLHRYVFGDMNRHESALYSDVINKHHNSKASHMPLLLATTTSTDEVIINGRAVEAEQTNIYVQRVALNFVHEGELYIPQGIIKPVTTRNSAHIYETDVYNGRLMLGIGELEFRYDLPDIEGVQYEEVIIAAQHAHGLSIWNVEAELWEPFAPYNNASLDAAYIDDGAIRMLMTIDVDYMAFYYPYLSAKGVVPK